MSTDTKIVIPENFKTLVNSLVLPELEIITNKSFFSICPASPWRRWCSQQRLPSLV